MFLNNWTLNRESMKRQRDMHLKIYFFLSTWIVSHAFVQWHKRDSQRVNTIIHLPWSSNCFEWCVMCTRIASPRVSQLATSSPASTDSIVAVISLLNFRVHLRRDYIPCEGRWERTRDYVNFSVAKISPDGSKMSRSDPKCNVLGRHLEFSGISVLCQIQIFESLLIFFVVDCFFRQFVLSLATIFFICVDAELKFLLEL